MFEFFPLPPWDAMHPLLVHFPVAILLVAPLLVVAGVIARGTRGRAWFHAALLLMVVGTAGAWIAVASGEAGEDAAERVAGTKELLHEHEELGELARNAFTGLTIVFAVLAFLTGRRPGHALFETVLPLVFLIPYAVGMAALANAAHHGGMLVHERGVIAQWAGSGAATPATGAEEVDDD